MIRGRKGGKDGANTGHVPSEEPNTLRSRATARILDLVSEGPITGLVDGAKSIYFDDVPLQASDGSANFEGVTWEQRFGTPDQTPIAGFPDVESEVLVNNEVRNDKPVTMAVTHPDTDAIRLKLRVPALYKREEDGDVVRTSITLAIEVQPSGGSYTEVRRPVIYGKCVGPYEEQYRIPLDGSAPWNIRVTRITQDYDDESEYVAKSYVASYTELIDAHLSYPDSALMAVTADSQLFGGRLPRRSYDMKGRVLKVPSNYNPTTRAYTGNWDGTFQNAWTDNPAWIFYDILTHPRYALGEFLEESQVDKWQLYQVAQYCDELVPDGFGGTEPRFAINAWIATRQEAYTVLTVLASAFRGMPFWTSNTVTVAQDSPKDPTRLIAPADVVGGEFTYQGAALKARHTVALVQWNDPDDNYRAALEVVEDADGIFRHGWRETRVAAFGCTSRGQAARTGRWLLHSERHESETVAYTAGMDHADTLPGEIIAIADPSRAGVRLGGRILAQDGGAGSFTLDAEHEAKAGDQLLVTRMDDTIATLDITGNGATKDVVTVMAMPATAVLPNALYIVQTTQVAPALWRVLSVRETEPNLFEVTALLYDETKYAAVEQGLTLEPRQTSLLPTGPLLPPTDLTVQESLYKDNNAIMTRIDLSWAPSPDPRVTVYRVESRAPDGNWTQVQLLPSTTAAVMGAQAGLWSFRVTALANGDSVGVRSSTLEVVDYQILGKTAPPADVTGLTAVRAVNGVQLTWNEVTDLDLVGYDVRRGTDWATAVIVAERYVGTTLFVQRESVDEETYLVRARDTLGILSVGTAAVTTSSPTIPPVTGLHIYQIGSKIKLRWEPPAGTERYQYEIRYGNSWATGILFGVTASAEFEGEISVSVTTTTHFMVRPFMRTSAGTRAYGAETAKDFTHYPVVGSNIITTTDYRTLSWPGTKSNVSVDAGGNLVLDAGQTTGYYDFSLSLGAEYFGRCWIEHAGTVEATDALEIDAATMEIADATFPIQPAYDATPQFSIFLLDPVASDPLIVDADYTIASAETIPISGTTQGAPFVEADYKFTTQGFRIVFSREEGDETRPVLTALKAHFDVPNRML